MKTKIGFAVALVLLILSTSCIISLRPDDAVEATRGRASTATEEYHSLSATDPVSFGQAGDDLRLVRSASLETHKEELQLARFYRWASAEEQRKAAHAAWHAEQDRKAAEARERAAEAPRATQAAVAPSGDVWYRLAMCETGGKMDNPNTGNGYYGYFQFSLSTWQSVGGPGYPHHHSYDTQLHYAQILQARSGWGQWPACSRKLGLR